MLTIKKLSRKLSLLSAVLFLLASISAGTIFPVSVSAVTQATYYVSPLGSDSNSGTFDSPFQTIAKAQQVVRTINSNMTGDIIVILRGGTYNITSPISFNTSDSGTNGYVIKYQAYTGETPIISGGTQVTGWTQYSGDIYRAPLTRSAKLRQLWVNGVRAIMAVSGDLTGQGTYGTFIIAGTESWALTSGSTADGLQFNTADLPAISNPGDAEIVSQSGFAYHTVGLRDVTTAGSYRVALFQQPYGAIALSEPSAWGMGFLNSNNKYRIQNAYEFLNQPGQFYFNKSTQYIYYYKRVNEDMSTATVIAPVSEGLISLNGTSASNRIKNIEFYGISFMYDHWPLMDVAGSTAATTVQSTALYNKYSSSGDWHAVKYADTQLMQAAISVTNADGINFVRNTFRNLGAMALSLGNDSRNCYVIGNVFRDIGSAAVNIGDPKNVYVGDGDFPSGVEGVPYNDVIKNNFIYQTCVEMKGATPIAAYFTDTCEISHNEIRFAPYTGISVGWGFNPFYGHDSSYNFTPSTTSKNIKINYNLIEDTMRELHDGGAIYTVGHIPNSQIFGNYVNRSGGLSGANAIYTDQSSAYFEIKDNVMHNYLNGVYWNVWGTYAYVHDINIHDNYADYISGYEGQYATNSTNTNNTSTWTSTTTLNALNAGIDASYKDILPGDLYPSAGLGTIEAENCIPLGRGAVYNDSSASGGKAVGTIDLFGDGLRIGKTTSDVNTITVYYASMQSGTYSLYVNGIHANDINFSSNGVWNGAYTSVSVRLGYTVAAGSVIELHRDKNDSGWNIDKIGLWMNEAINKTVSSSSIYGAGWEDGKGNDGSTANGWSPSATDTSPWWQVDCGSAYVFNKIELVARQDLDQPVTRRNFEIRASNVSDFSTYTVLGSQGSTSFPHAATWELTVADTNAYRYLRVAKTANEYFFISEFRALAASAVPTPFTPPQSSNLKLWLKPDTGVSKDFNDYVDTWADQSSSGNDVTQSTQANKPKWVNNGINGKPAILFDGSDDYLTTLGLTGNMNAFTFIMVLKPTALVNYNQSIGALGGWGQFMFHTSANGTIYVGTSSSSRLTTAGGTMANNTVQQYTYKYGSNTGTLYKNGTQNTTGSVNDPSSWTGFSIGQSSSLYTLNGYVAELLVYNIALSDADRQQVEGYLKAKYGY